MFAEGSGLASTLRLHIGGYRPETACKVLKRLARPRGVEPLTPRSVVWCSIQLSYGRVPRNPIGFQRMQIATPPGCGKQGRLNGG